MMNAKRRIFPPIQRMGGCSRLNCPAGTVPLTGFSGDHRSRRRPSCSRRLSGKIHRGLGLALWLCLISAGLSQAQTRVIRTDPIPYSVTATPMQQIEIEFSQAINPERVKWPNLRVRGNVGGNYLYFASVSQNLIRLRPLRPFFNGEQVTVTITRRLENNLGVAVQPFSFRFMVRNEFGTGLFLDSDQFPLIKGKDPVNLHVADMNHDFLPDIISANYSSNSISIFENVFGTHATQFSSITHISVGTGPTSVTTGDLNGDQDTDIAVANFLDNTVTVLLKNPQGTQFEYLQGSISTGERPLRVKLFDVDYDGDLDLLVLAFGRDAVEIYENDGNGQFSFKQRYNLFPAPADFALGDWNQDGFMDFVVGSSSTQNVYAMINDGQGHFTLFKEIDVGAPINQLLVQEWIGQAFNPFGVGLPDLAILSQAQNQMRVFANPSGNLWTDRPRTFPNFKRPLGMASADFDTAHVLNGPVKDYNLDLAVSSFDDSKIYVFRNQDGTGFSPNTSPLATLRSTIGPTAVATGDFDRDGDQDIVVAETQNQRLRVFWNHGGRGGNPFSIHLQVLDFDTVRVTQSKTLDLIARNISDLPATIRFVLQVQNEFSIPFADTTVGPGAEVALPVTFTPHDTLHYKAELTVKTEDAFQSGTNIVSLQGTGIRPIYVARPDTLNFGVVPPGRFRDAAELIKNIGNVRGKIQKPQIRPATPFFLLSDSVLYIDAKASATMEFRFLPTTLGTFFTEVTLQTDDPLDSTLTFVLKGISSAEPPAITSPDTLFATEDIFAAYNATANDPEGDSVSIWFEQLPHWLGVSPQIPTRVEGTPREGDLDTSFVVIASDGFLQDTLHVIVMVTPVNDPPELRIQPNQLSFNTQETQTVQFDLLASDPEDSTLSITGRNLPAGATLASNGRNRAHFSWVPVFGQSGTYMVTFTATEVYEKPPLSDSLTVTLTVGKILPDLQALEIRASETEVFLQHNVRFDMRWVNQNAPIFDPVVVAIQDNGRTRKDTTVAGMAIGEEIQWSVQLSFAESGTHTIALRVDPDNRHAEQDENNNVAQIEIKVNEGQLYVSPNPFTPNADGFNDRVQFDAREFVLRQPELKIYDFQGNLVRSLRPSPLPLFIWDGRDRAGEVLRPGIYLYVFYNDQKAIRSGHVVLAR